MADIVNHLRAWGLDVDTIKGYQTNGRPGTFKPRGVLCHHTASNKSSGNFGSLNVVANGRPDLPGPLCQFLLGRDGKVKVISLGRANHAGYGGPYAGIPANDGNSYLYGIEAENDGLGEAWPQVQYDAYVTLCASLLDFMNIDKTQVVFAHKEWAPTRKTDPRGIDMNTFRINVGKRLKKGPLANVIYLSNLKKGKFSPDVVRVKRHLKKLGFLSKSVVPTPFYGKNLVKAYKKYQESLGYSGKDASGIPGETSLRKLGFTVLP